jgi:hypothetical protein
MEASGGQEARAAGTPEEQQRWEMPDGVRSLLNNLQLGIGDFLRDPEPQPEALVALFTEMRRKARELLAEAGVPGGETGVGGGIIGGAVLARDVESVLVAEEGWMEVVPGTMQTHGAGWLSFEVACDIEGKRMLMPDSKIVGMSIPAGSLIDQPADGAGEGDFQLAQTHDAIFEALATIRRLAQKTDEEKIDWATAIAVAAVAAFRADEANIASHELGTFVAAVGALVGVHSGEQFTDAEMFDRAARHPKARAEFWLTEDELRRANSGEEVVIGPFVVKASIPLPEEGEPEAEFRDFSEGDRVLVHGGKEGFVVAGPDSEGRMPIQVEGCESVEVFDADEVQLVADREEAAPAAAPATDGEGQAAEPTPLKFTEGDRVETRDGKKGTIAATPDPGKLFPVLIDGTEVPEAFAGEDLSEEVPF